MIVTPSASRIKLMYAASAVLIAGSAVAWWFLAYQSPSQVFWGMVANGLHTGSYSRQLEQSTSRNGLTTSLRQTTFIQFGAVHGAQAQTTLTQAKNTVVTETVGDQGWELVRYIDIADGTSDVKVKDEPAHSAYAPILRKWAEVPVAADGASPQADGQAGSDVTQPQLPLFEQIVFGLTGGNVVPLVNLPAKQQQQMLAVMRDNVIFDTDFKQVKRSWQEGRPQFTYRVKVQAVAYAGLQRELARSLGYQLFNDLDPNDYQGQAPTEVDMTVDIWSHQLRSVSYVGQKRTETYGTYGVYRQLGLPKPQVSSQELQQQLKNLTRP